MTLIFGIMFLAYFVRLTIPLPIESLVECVDDDKFKTSDGSYLQCKLSCQCPSDNQKEVHISYAGCQKCCCSNMDYKRIEKDLLETNKTLEYTLQENRKLTDYNTHLKKISEEKSIALHKSNKKNKISAFIIAISSVSSILVITIVGYNYKNRLKNVISRFFPPSNVTTDSQGLIDSKWISVEKKTSSKLETIV
nr:uncharacterized protein LOC105850151 [Hydra vulgaris]XP_047132047.1 uncharacterized protein LOC124811035 [Hydra vulgaris]